MPRLIVNADDFGLTAGINRAILELHQAGVLTSATLMARAPATDEAIEIAKGTPTLGVGCHVVLVDGEPVLSGARDIPNIAAASGRRFEPTVGRFLMSIHNGFGQSRIGPRIGEKVDHQIEAEARAQIQFLQQRGVLLTHVDTHKHTHMFPRVLRPVLRAARSCGIRAVRNPFEPAWSIAATPNAPFVRRTEVRLLRLLARTFLRIVAEEGCHTTSGALGVLATGTLDTPTLQSLVTALAQGNHAKSDAVYELVTHPGYNDADLAHANTRLLSQRETERQSLAALSTFPNLALTTFGSLTTDH